jgi:hypothetical protein
VTNAYAFIEYGSVFLSICWILPWSGHKNTWYVGIKVMVTIDEY